jgi:hypothetical protein
MADPTTCVAAIESVFLAKTANLRITGTIDFPWVVTWLLLPRIDVGLDMVPVMPLPLSVSDSKIIMPAFHRCILPPRGTECTPAKLPRGLVWLCRASS